jgi:hypothetical protein
MRADRRSLWLGAAALLLGLAAYFMSGPEEAPKPEARVDFPVRQNPDVQARAVRRRTLLPLLAAAAAVDAGHKRLRSSDPVLAALPPKGPGTSAVVFEANAIRNSPVGELLFDCLRTRHHGQDPLEDFRQRSGIDLSRDLDRMAVSNHAVLLSGNFQNANWDQLFAGAPSKGNYGDQGVIYDISARTSDKGPQALGRWGNQMIIEGETPADIEAVIDRLEGRAPDAPPILDESDTYGEVYGVIDPADLASALPSDVGNVADQLKNAAQQVKMHIDASGDVAMVADISGSDSQQVGDLAKTLGGALALGRLKVQGDGPGDKLLGDLLDQAKVIPADGSFRTELALPMSVLQKHLGWCREGVDAGAAPAAAAAPK